VWVSHQHLNGGRTSAARGWLARAERALENAPGPCPGRGWVAVERARHAQRAEEQRAHAERALEIARATGDDDLEVFALSLQGRATVSAGDRDGGLALLEEAMTAAAAGRVRNMHTLGEAYCSLLEGCATAGDWERATEWCALVADFSSDNDIQPLFGACRTIHANILVATGQWSEAERALETALATHARYVPQLSAPTVAALAELRVRQGRLTEAERLLAGREEQPASLGALAALRRAEGRPEEAEALLERGLRISADHAVHASQLLAPLVETRLARADVDGARAAADELVALGRATAVRLVQARADLAVARVALGEGHTEEAAEAAHRALAGFGTLAMPFDAAEARLELARAVAGAQPAVALDEARTAHGAFRDLGATRAMDTAAALVRELGGGTAPRPRAAGELTAREQEVLDLVALGMSNAQIAATLVISEKTAGHHVSSILMKLGVPNRAAAAAAATRS